MSFLPTKIISSTAASPTVLITEIAHGLTTGTKIEITGKGYFTVTVITNTSFSLQQYANIGSNVTGTLNEYIDKYFTSYTVESLLTFSETAAPWIDNTVVLFGDSHTRRNGPTLSTKSASLVGYELTDTVSGAAQVYFGGDGYFVMANTILKGAFRILHNTAVGGETISQINDRIDTALNKYRPRYAVYMAGTNDIQSSSITSISTADTAAASAIANIAQGWAKIRSYNVIVLAYTITPRTGLSGFQRRTWAQVNSWIRKNANTTPGVFLAGDSAKAAGNPSTGNWLESGEYGAVATTNADSIHATSYGYYLIGCESARRLTAILPSIQSPSLNSPELAYDATNGNNPLGNLLINGKMLGTGGTQTAPATGTVADSWTVQATPTIPVSGTIVTSKVTRSISSNDATQVAHLGEWQQVSMTGGSTAGVLALQQEIQNLSGGAFAIGDVVCATLQFETDETNWSQAGVGAAAPIVEIQFGPNGGVGVGTYQLNGAPGVVGRIPSGVAKSPEVVIPAGLTRIFIRVLFRGQGTWRISDVDFRKVPDRTLTLV